jgi:hypothetical protein
VAALALAFGSSFLALQPASAAVTCLDGTWSIATNGTDCTKTFTPASAGTITLPSAVTAAVVEIIGGAGGTGGDDGQLGSGPGQAGKVVGTISLSGGSTLGIYPGNRGADGVDNATVNTANLGAGAGGSATISGYDGGAGGGVGTYGASGGGAGGGAASVVTFGAVRFVAGGGAGGGGSGNIVAAEPASNSYVANGTSNAGAVGATTPNGSDGGGGGGGGGGHYGGAGGGITWNTREYTGVGGYRGGNLTNGMASVTNTTVSTSTAGTIKVTYTAQAAPTAVSTAKPTGTVTAGQTLTAANTFTGQPEPTTFTYQWQASADGSTNWTNVSGATSSTLALNSSHVGKFILVQMTASNGVGTAASSNSSSTSTAVSIAASNAPTLATASDTGSSTSDKVTNDNTPTLNLTGLTTGTNVTVTATKAGATDVTATIDAVDATSKTITLPTLADGTWTATVTQSLNGQTATSTQLTNLVIDTTGPQVTAINFIPTLTKLNQVTVEVIFNETISNTAGHLSQDAIDLGGITAGWTVSSVTRKSADDKVAVFSLTRSGATIINGTLTLDALAGLARDQFGQLSDASSAGLQASGKFDQNRPTATWSTLPPALTNQSSITATLEFSEPIRNLASGDFLFTGASTSCVATPAASSIAANASAPYRVVVTISGCSAQGSITLKLSSDAVDDYTDTIGNTGPEVMPIATFTRDTVAPTITAITKTIDGTDVDYEYTFSEAISGLTSANITPTNSGGNSNGWSVSTPTLKNGTTATYRFTVSNATTYTSGNLTLAINTANVTDTAGNALAANTLTVSSVDQSKSVLTYLPTFTLGTMGTGGVIATPIAPQFTLNGRGTAVTGVRITITNARSGDNFNYTMTSGFNANSNSNFVNGLGTVTVDITATGKTDAEWNTLIRTIKLYSTSTDNTSRTFDFHIKAAGYSYDTGHLYLDSTGTASWADAKAAAAASTFAGMTGHLVTVSSAAEDTFVKSVQPATWLAMTKAAPLTAFTWQAGPEDGRTPAQVGYSAFGSGIDNSGDCIWYWNTNGWDDVQCANLNKYVTEFGEGTTPTALGLLKTGTMAVDLTAPAVTSVRGVTANGKYAAGQTVTVKVTFSEPIVTTGTPNLGLALGGASTTYVDCAAGAINTTLECSFTVASNHASADLNYAATSSLILNGGTVTDASGNAAVLTLPATGNASSLAGTSAIVIEGVRVFLPLQAGSSTNNGLNAGQGRVVASLATGTAPAEIEPVAPASFFGALTQAAKATLSALNIFEPVVASVAPQVGLVADLSALNSTDAIDSKVSTALVAGSELQVSMSVSAQVRADFQAVAYLKSTGNWVYLGVQDFDSNGQLIASKLVFGSPGSYELRLLVVPAGANVRTSKLRTAAITSGTNVFSTPSPSSTTFRRAVITDADLPASSKTVSVNIDVTGAAIPTASPTPTPTTTTTAPSGSGSTPAPTATPTATPTASPTASPTPTPTQASPTPSATRNTPTPTPTRTTPAPTPSATTPVPTAAPTSAAPTPVASPEPSGNHKHGICTTGHFDSRTGRSSG